MRRRRRVVWRKSNTGEEVGSVCVGNKRQAHSSLPKLTLDLCCDYHMMVSLLFAFFVAFCRLEWSHGMHMGFFFKKIFNSALDCSLTSRRSLYVGPFEWILWRNSQTLWRCICRVMQGAFADWRKMRMPSLIWILHFVNLTEGLDNTKILRHKREYSSTTCHPPLSNAVVKTWLLWNAPYLSPFSQWKIVNSRSTLHMETISVFFQLSGNNVVMDFHLFHPLAHYSFESLALYFVSDLLKKSKLPVKLRTINGAQRTRVSYSVSSARAQEEYKAHILCVFCPQAAPPWADSARQAARHAQPRMAACPVNLASSSTWSWMGCGRGAPVCPPVPGATTACARHTSAPAPVGTNEHHVQEVEWCLKGVKQECPFGVLWPAGCKDDCASCFSENFCTHCHPGHFMFRGKCENSCPNGLTANTVLRECTGETLFFTKAVCRVHMCFVELQSNVRCLCPSVLECSAGCEVCVRRNVCVRCRADLYSLHGQCHLTCPRGFEPDVQLMQCVPQGERSSFFSLHSWDVKYKNASHQLQCTVSV